MGIEKLNDKEKKTIRRLGKANIPLYIAVVCYLLGIFFLWSVQERLLEHTSMMDSDPVVTKDMLKGLIKVNFNYFIVILAVIIIYCLGWIRSNQLYRKIINKLLD